MMPKRGCFHIFPLPVHTVCLLYFKRSTSNKSIRFETDLYSERFFFFAFRHSLVGTREFPGRSAAHCSFLRMSNIILLLGVGEREERVKTAGFSFCLFSRRCRDDANACGARVEQRVNNEGKTCTNITDEGWKITIISAGVEASARRRRRARL